MEELDLNFCCECSDELINPDLLSFWRTLCFKYITKRGWLSYYCKGDFRYIDILEKKRFVMTTDYEDRILVKPHGVYDDGNETYLICLKPEMHFERVRE